MIKTTSAILITAMMRKVCVSTVPNRAALRAANIKCKLLKFPSANCEIASVRHHFFVRRRTTILQYVVERFGITAQSSRGKQSVIRGDNLHESVSGAGVAVLSGVHVLVISGEQAQTRELISRHQTLDFIQRRGGIEGPGTGLKHVGREPHGVAVGFTGL